MQQSSTLPNLLPFDLFTSRWMPRMDMNRPVAQRNIGYRKATHPKPR